MRKGFIVIVFMSVFLAACDKQVMSFSEVNQVSGDVWEHVEPGLRLQMISSEDTAYIVFDSDYEVLADYELQGNVVVIKLSETKGKRDTKKAAYVYELTTDAKHDTIDIWVNGKSQPFDLATVVD